MLGKIISSIPTITKLESNNKAGNFSEWYEKVSLLTGMVLVTISQNLWLFFLTFFTLLFYYSQYRSEIKKWFPLFIAVEIVFLTSLVITHVIQPTYQRFFGIVGFKISYNIDIYLSSIFLLDESITLIIFENQSQLLRIIFSIVYIAGPFTFLYFLVSLKDQDEQLFQQLIWDSVIATTIVSLCFIFLPSKPPWAIYHGIDQPHFSVSYLLGNLYTDFVEYRSLIIQTFTEFTIIVFGSLPSVHVLLASYCNFVAIKYKLRFANLWKLNFLLTVMGVIYLGHHFIFDVIVAITISHYMISIRKKSLKSQSSFY